MRAFVRDCNANQRTYSIQDLEDVKHRAYKELSKDNILSNSYNAIRFGSNSSEVEKIFGFVNGENLPLPGYLSVIPSGKYVSDLPILPGSTGDVLYLDTVSGSNNLSPIKPATGPVKPVYIKITDTSAIMITSGGGSESPLGVYDSNGVQVTAGATGIRFTGNILVTTTEDDVLS